jgi:phenylalanyl-tRNA synthetase beta chain
MKILLSWLRDFVNIPESPQELAHALTMAGHAVDEVAEHSAETVFEFDITSNRPDCMNHFGMAREIAALLNRPLRPPEIQVPEGLPAASSKASIEIRDPDLCPRYSARVILGVEVKPSPDWLRKRLELCGIRSINNLADLTNYVLLELGHPTHAFDLDLLRGSKIVVRRALPGELLRTLDGGERTLGPEHLVIADAERAVALAGVMGGLETEISASTRNVLIESAWFKPGAIRGASRHFGIHTEASHRFERGADPEATVRAADRIATLLAQVSPGTVLQGCLDEYPNRQTRPSIRLQKNTVRRLLGVDVPEPDVERILRALEFDVARDGAGWGVKPPSHRLDVDREVDAVEEIARLWGYERFPPALPQTGIPVEAAPLAAEERQVRETVRALGYDETICYSFMSAEDGQRFGSWEPVFLRNPISEPWAAMRNSAVPGMLRAVEWNLNRNESDIRLMEIGRLYRRVDGGYEEPAVAVLAATGLARPGSFRDKGSPYDFYELKSDVAQVLAGFAIKELSFEDRELPSYYAAGGSARVVADGHVIAHLGELDSATLAAQKIRQPVYLAEIFLNRLYGFGLRQPKHQPLPRVPGVHRDFSLLVPEGVRFAEVKAAIGRTEYLVELDPVEVFRGEQVPAGYYSLLLRARWQKEIESLTDDEVNGYGNELVQRLKRLNIKQRA